MFHRAFVVLAFSGIITQSAVNHKEEEQLFTGTQTEGYVGTWELSYDNDRKIMDGAFPDIFAFGSELVIRPDGKVYWHIGIDYHCEMWIPVRKRKIQVP